MDDIYSFSVMPSVLGPCAVGSGGKRLLLCWTMAVNADSATQEVLRAAALSTLHISGAAHRETYKTSLEI